MRLLTYICTGILALCLAIPFLGTWSWLQVEKKQVRKEVKRQIIRGLDRSELTELTFSVEDAARQLEWHHDHEFQWNGEMYDIVEQNVESDSVTYWCWWDHKESELERRLEALLERSSGKQTPDDSPVILLVDHLKKCCHDWQVIALPIYDSDRSPLKPYSGLTDLTPGTRPPSPPPDIA